MTTEIKERIVGYILAAFGFVAALAWNEAVKGLIETLFPLDHGSLLAKFIYAIFVTIIVVVVSIYLAKYATSTPKK